LTVWALSIRRPVLATVMTIALILFGWIGYTKLPVRELPDVDFPIVSVITVLPGANPEVVEKEVTEVLEEEINTIEGIKTLTSESAEQVSRITVEFNLDRDIDVAAQDVRDKIARVRRQLPDDTEEPVVSKLDLDAQAIMWISLNAPNTNMRVLTDFADNIVKERLQRLPGVGSIIIGGEKRFAVRVRLDAQRLAAYQLTVDDVVSALRRENVEIPSGRIESRAREFVVKTEGEFPTPEAFNDLIIAFRDDVPVRLRQVGTAAEGDENERTVGRFNLAPSVSLGVLKQSNANTIDVARTVRAEIVAMGPSLPPGYKVEIGYDAATFIEESVAEVQQSLLIAGALVVLVIFLFLHTPRSAVIPALAIPTSILATFGVMYFLGFTINNLTLLALTLSIGVVVDDAIIVLENVHRHMEEGEERVAAALQGTAEIAFAAIAATLTLVAVFLPVAFITGIIGRFFYEFGVSVAAAVLVSLFVALTLTPMLCSRLLVVDEPRGIFRAFERALSRFSAAYRRLLERALDHRALVAGIAMVTLAASAGLFLLLGKEFVPPEDRGGFMTVLESPEGSTLAYHDRLQLQVEKILSETPEVRTSAAFIGLAQAGPGAVNRGVIFSRLYPRSERQRSQQDVLTELRQRFAQIPGIRVFVLTFSALQTGGRGKPLQFVIQNPDFTALQTYTNRMLERVRALPAFTDVDTNLRLNKPELRIHIDRNKAAALGVSAAGIANTLRILLGGDDVTKFKRGNERYDVIVQLQEGDRFSPEQLSQIYTRTRSGSLVQLANLVDVEEGVGPSSLNHYNRRRSAIIDANLQDKPLGTALEEVNTLAREILPAGFTTAVAGESKDFEESFASLTFTFVLAIIAVYLVLAGQFESFVHPFTILLALPLAIFGAFLGLVLLGMTLNIYSFIGMVMLVGLVTKNSILLVDYTNTLRAQGRDMRAAVAEAGGVRLRPILMTSVSTLFGILPVAIGLGAGAESRRPLGVAVAAGITVSTLMTLIVVPVTYTLIDDALKAVRAWVRGRAAAVPEPTVPEAHPPVVRPELLHRETDS
jgi:multidrug efflux pump